MNDKHPVAEGISAVETLGPSGTEIGLADIVVSLGEQKYFVLRFALIAVVIGVVVSLILPPTYIGRAVVMPPQREGSGISALAGLGGLAGLAAMNVKTPDEMYIALLGSDTVSDELIAKFKLMERYHANLLSQARGVLKKNVQLVSDKKSGFITVAVSDKSPQFAADLANAYVDELRKSLDRLAVTDAQQRRVFFQKEIDRTLTRLSEAQVVFDQAQRTSGVVSLDEQVQTSIRASADLKAKIAALEIRLQSMSSYATEQNPEVQRLRAELAATRDQLVTLMQGEKSDSGVGHTRDDSTAALANIRAFREVKYQEAMLDQLRQQLALAQLDEAREGPLVQQIDKALPPDRKSAPRRAFIVLVAAIIGTVFGIFWALLRMISGSDSRYASQFARIRQAWRLRTPKVKLSK